MQPTVGRIVYYRDHHLHERAAIVTHVDHDVVIDLAVFFPDRLEFIQHVKQDELHGPHTWDWMPFQSERAKKDALIDAKVLGEY